MGPFVDAPWLRERLGEVVVCHVGWGAGGADGAVGYAAGHVPGAVYADLDRDLAAPPTAADGRHPLPDPATWAATLGRLGISPGDRVVAYDDGVGGIAARLVWMLRAVGIEAALLDGGLTAWGQPLDTDPVLRTPTLVPLTPWPDDLVVAMDDVLDAVVLLDARDAERYRGDSAGPDARAGHIPGARNVPFTGNVDSTGRLRPRGELEGIYAPLVADGAIPVASCGSGVTACHDLLVLEELGLGRGRLYPGSWSQWAGQVGRPITTGETP